MKHEREITETYQLDADTKLTVACDGKGNPTEVVTSIIGAGYRSYDPATLERIAAIIYQLRRDACDFRNVCAGHGYYDGYSGCPKCAAEQLEQDAAAALAALEAV